jgi:hypothetical protein
MKIRFEFQATRQGGRKLNFDSSNELLRRNLLLCTLLALPNGRFEKTNVSPDHLLGP